jgi:hypothetical protein
MEYHKAIKNDFERRYEDVIRDYESTSRDKNVLEKQLHEIREENHILYHN